MTQRDPREDAARVLDTVAEGGIAIIPLDVAYGIVGHTEGAIRKIFAAKRRSYEKPSGMFSNWELFTEIHQVGEREREIVDTIIHRYDLPFSVVAPFRRDHPFFRGVDPFVLESSSKAGTLDMLLNAGPLHNELARQSRERGLPVFGSSANVSLTGSKFRLRDIEPEVRAVADLEIDYGLSRYHNPEGVSSTIIDLRTFKTVRVGVVYDRLCEIFRHHFDIDLRAIAAA